jgi:thiol-disulfide isomerase/thioredoxin
MRHNHNSFSFIVSFAAAMALIAASASVSAQNVPRVGPTVAASSRPAGHPARPPQQPVAQTQPAGPPGKFRCDEMEYKWGKVWALEKVEHTFIIHNDGPGILTIEAKPTCGCTIAEFDKTIAPGGEGKIKAVLTTSNSNSPTYSKSINVLTNDPEKRTVVLILTGEVKQRVSTDPPVFNAYFGQLAPGVNLTKTFKLTNNTDKPMKLELMPPAQPSCFKVSLKELEAGKVAELTVTAEPPFKEDTNVAQFVVKTGIEGAPDLNLPCNIVKPPTVQLIPAQLRLPAIAVASAYRQAVTVRNNGDKPLKVLSVETSDERIKLEQKEVEPGKIWSVGVEIPSGFTATPGKPPVVTIKTDYEAKPVYTIPFLMMGQPQMPTTMPTFTTPEAMVGRMAPSLPVQTIDGRQLRIGPGSNQVMLVNFWASWCPANRQQMAMLDQLYQTYRRRGVEFINISVDQYRPQTELTEILRAQDSKIPLGLDTNRRIAQAFSVTELPTTFLIGRNGIVEAVRRGIGRSEQELDAIAEALQDQLDKLTEGKSRNEFTPRPLSMGTTCRLQQLPASPVPAAGAVLSVEALAQDAGLFKPKSKGEYKLYYRNTGTQPLEIKSIKGASPGVTIDESYAKTLAPGATAFVICSFESPAKPENFVHQVSLESNAAGPALNVMITGKSRPYIEVQTAGRTVEFVTGVRTFSVPRLATLIYNGQDKVEYKEPKSSSAKFEATIDPRPGMALVTVKALPPFEQGEHKATITIETNLPEQPVVEVPVRLVMPPRIEVKPAVLEAPLGRSGLPLIVNIVNSGAAFNILGIDKSKPEIQTQGFPEADGVSYRLQVTLPTDFVIAPEGEKITLRTDDKEYGEIVIPIRQGTSQRAGLPRPRGTAPVTTLPHR